MDDLFTEGCPRNITRSKYEKQNLETYFWWQRLFKIMEEEIRIPPYRRQTVIKDIFPRKILKRILKVLSFVVKDDESGEFSISINSKKGSGTDVSIPSRHADFKKDDQDMEQAEKVTTNFEDKGELDDKVDLMSVAGHIEPVQISQQTVRGGMPKKREAGPNNPYVRFFNRNPERVAIWRELPPLKLEEMNLSQKSVAVTEAIAVDFVNWIIRLGGETTTTLDVQQVVKMFEIGFNVHAATSLEAISKELPSLTKTLSASMNLPEKCWKEKLQSEIAKDIVAFKKKKKWRAFETTLPKNIRYIPPRVDGTVKWLQIKAPEDLVTMQNVWEGITHLRSTRAYCKWLIEHPYLPAPKYLIDFGMLSPDYYLQPHYSIETIEGGDTLEDSHAMFFELKAK